MEFSGADLGKNCREMSHNHFLGLPWHAMTEVRCKESDLSQQAERNRWLRCGNIGDDRLSHGERN